VHITIDRIRVNQSASAADTDPGWYDVVLNPPGRFDLLALSNGVLADLGQTLLPAGTYTQMRLVLATNDAANPLANSVTPTGGTETPLATPSAQQTGLKVKLDTSVPSNQVADVVIDFDACNSVVRRGNSGKFNLKPVITATTVLYPAGQRVVGYVDPTIALPSTIVSLQTGGAPAKATVPDGTGAFTLYPVPVGTYDLVVTSAGHSTAVATGVPVLSTAWTMLNGAAAPIAPPASAAGAVTITVTLGNPAATATVQALQSLGGGPIEAIASATVDPATGPFSFSLPLAAPVRTSYVAGSASLVFAPDAAAAGKYTLLANSNGVSDPPHAIDFAAVVAPVVFAFP